MSTDSRSVELHLDLWAADFHSLLYLSADSHSLELHLELWAECHCGQQTAATSLDRLSFCGTSSGTVGRVSLTAICVGRFSFCGTSSGTAGRVSQYVVDDS